MSVKRVLSVGQCGADHSSIASAIKGHFTAEVVSADSVREALDQLRQENFDLVLVNRVLDADGSSGLRLVEEIKADEALRPVPVMLVSNHEDAQEQAVRAGAVRGFGKAALRHPQTVERLRPYLAGTSGSEGRPPGQL
jgi:CheY-like chemotaxis protein